MEELIYKKILDCDFENLEYFVDNKSIVINIAQKIDDLRIYVCLMHMIQYCKKYRKEYVADLSHYTAIYLYVKLNYIEGGYRLSYQHMYDAITYDPDNYENKESFLKLYFEHPDLDTNIQYDMSVAKELIENIPNSEIARKVLEKYKHNKC